MRPTEREGSREKDHLHLIGLSRIPRCAACRRFEALWRTHEEGVPPAGPLPPVPSCCKYQICRPLAARSACLATSKG